MVVKLSFLMPEVDFGCGRGSHLYVEIMSVCSTSNSKNALQENMYNSIDTISCSIATIFIYITKSGVH